MCSGLFSATAAAQSTTDYDNLIDIRTLAHLNTIRYDFDGNGTLASGATTYAAAFS